MIGCSRRDFITRVAQAGGFSAAFIAMQSLGLAPTSHAHAQTVSAAPNLGKGTSVVILGAGIAGLVAAYELHSLGFSCTVLESRERPGGRNYTVRPSDTVTLSDGSKQQCGWETPHYQNFGPARLPSIHPTILGYCRTLGVELQVEVNSTRSSYLQNDAANGGKPVVQRPL